MRPRYYFDADLLSGLLRYRMRPYLSDVATAYRKDGTMPEIGGKKLATDFGSMMADVRKAIDDAKLTVAGAVHELKDEIAIGARNSAKAIRIEATAVRDGFAQLLGNGAPVDEAETVTSTSTSSEVGQIPAAALPLQQEGAVLSTPPAPPAFHHDTGDPVK